MLSAIQRRLEEGAEQLLRMKQSAGSTVSISCSAQYDIPEARMPVERTIGKPDAGNPHVRFERGPQETEPPRLRSTNEMATPASMVSVSLKYVVCTRGNSGVDVLRASALLPSLRTIHAAFGELRRAAKRPGVLTAFQSGGAEGVSRRSKLAAHSRAALEVEKMAPARSMVWVGTR
jgi:hypothetical protein